jgi:membrane protein DedA with SNARE-associated domain
MCGERDGSRAEERAAIEQLILQYGILIVALLVFAGELGIPTGIPMEVALLITGGFAIHSAPQLIVGLIAVVLADLGGTVTLHLVARTGGARLLSRLLQRHEQRSREILEEWRERFGRRDIRIVFVGRLVPIVRMYMALGTGLLRIPFRDYVIGAAPASFLWAGLPLGVGYFFSPQVNQIAAQYTRVEHLAIIGAPVLIAIGITVWWVHRERSLRGRIWRVRSSVALAAAVTVIIYAVQTAESNRDAIQHGMNALPGPVLWSWLALLAGLACALLLVAAGDFRAVRRALHRSHRSITDLVRAEFLMTTCWLGLITIASAVMIGLELHYPSI